VKRVLLAALCAWAAACTTLADPRGLADSQADVDFETYHLQRVGLVPFDGDVGGPEQGRLLQDAFLHEFASQAPFEVVALDAGALAEVVRSQPYRRGRLKPLTVLQLAKRYSLDGLLIGTVTHVSAYPPQVLGLEIDLVACETGLPIWSSRVQMDAADPGVREAVEAYARVQQRTGEPDGVGLTFISPTRFARFAAHQVAATLPGAP